MGAAMIKPSDRDIPLAYLREAFDRNASSMTRWAQFALPPPGVTWGDG
jgi:hypothetical protein